MSEKLPQPTAVLVQRLRRVAKALDREAHADFNRGFPALAAQWRARANTCLQAAARLEEFRDAYGPNEPWDR